MDDLFSAHLTVVTDSISLSANYLLYDLLSRNSQSKGTHVLCLERVWAVQNAVDGTRSWRRALGDVNTMLDTIGKTETLIIDSLNELCDQFENDTASLVRFLKKALSLSRHVVVSLHRDLYGLVDLEKLVSSPYLASSATLVHVFPRELLEVISREYGIAPTDLRVYGLLDDLRQRDYGEPFSRPQTVHEADERIPLNARAPFVLDVLSRGRPGRKAVERSLLGVLVEGKSLRLTENVIHSLRREQCAIVAADNSNGTLQTSHAPHVGEDASTLSVEQLNLRDKSLSALLSGRLDADDLPRPYQDGPLSGGIEYVPDVNDDIDDDDPDEDLEI